MSAYSGSQKRGARRERKQTKRLEAEQRNESKAVKTIPRKNKRQDKMRPEEARFWQERREAEEAADQRASDRQTKSRDKRKDADEQHR